MVASCTGSKGQSGESGPVPPARIAVAPTDNARAVGLHAPVKVVATGGTLAKVSVSTATGERLRGTWNANRTVWTAADSLIPTLVYRVEAEAVNRDGQTSARVNTFSTEAPRKVLGAHVTPEEGSSVGVGMPVAVKFDQPVRNRAAVEKRLEVKSSKPIQGAWRWIDSKEVRYRPKTYWPAHTRVTVNANLDKVNAGPDIWGVGNIEQNFSITNSVVTKVDLVNHHSRTFIDGKLARTIPVTGGKPGWETRSGTKVILDKRENYLFTNEMIGAAESYALTARWAMRVTVSGEFMHTAYWSTGAQGNSNVSHGCVGMSTDNSAWLYSVSHIGDPVEFVNPDGDPMELNNGYGDWNLSWTDWRAGSALG